jgi:hypothetical protein
LPEYQAYFDENKLPGHDAVQIRFTHEVPFFVLPSENVATIQMYRNKCYNWEGCHYFITFNF